MSTPSFIILLTRGLNHSGIPFTFGNVLATFFATAFISGPLSLRSFPAKGKDASPVPKNF